MHKLLIILAATFLFLVIPNPVGAQDFRQNFFASYELLDTGETRIHYEIELTNLNTEKYIQKYELSLQGLNPENIEVSDSEGEVQTFKKQNKLTINFKEALVGKNKSRKLSLSFTDKNLLTKSGEVWEVYLPTIQNIDSFQTYTIKVLVPHSFGQLAYISPQTYSKSANETHTIYRFDKNTLKDSTVTAAFGQFQVFSFALTYHLENPVNKTALIPIALPPDTAFQKMIYQTIEPKPIRISRDEDDNWIAEFELKPQQKIDVNASGHVQIFAEPYKTEFKSPEELKKYLQPQKYWEVNHPKIQSIAQNLKTPKQVYDFVVDTLSYNYDRVDPRVKRMGAVKALSFPDQAICMEFTDLFIALSRAAGIPAREVNGFADTNNQQLQPLSLVADVLHSWPEYWDDQKQIWVPVDPTWADTTGGIDFFSKLDLKHFVFVIHGTDSQEPYPAGSYKLGAYPQKDVYVSLSQLPQDRQPNSKIKINRIRSLALNKLNFEVVVTNTGPVAIYDQSLEIFVDEQKLRSFKLDFLLPYQQIKFEFDIKSGFLGSKAPEKISASLQNFGSEYEINKDQIVLPTVTIIFFTIFSVTFILYWKLRHR